MALTIEQMENHIVEMLNHYTMRTDLHHKLFINLDTFRFREDVSDKDKKWFYKFVCKELKQKTK